MVLLTETLEKLHVETIDEAIPLIAWADVDWDTDSLLDADDGYTGVMLPPDHTDEQCREFLNTLAFDYNDGYGCQVVYGTIMLKNGAWLEREEYDGSEWWQYRSVPQYPY